MLQTVLKQYGMDEHACRITEFGSGLINTTWLIDRGGRKFILQRINHKVFLTPEDIAYNIRKIGNHLKLNFPGYLFVDPCITHNDEDLVKVFDSYFRLFPFVDGSHTIDVVETARQAYEAARQFARFTKLLSSLDPLALKITLPDFHDLSIRYEQFEKSLETGNRQRILESAELISYLQQQKGIADEFEKCRQQFKIRCIHHDTKISNVLFDSNDTGLCVIDLDTVMPGYFISDVGDMMRTYLSPVNEEEQDFLKIEIRKDFYAAIVDGYMSEMGEELNAIEKDHVHFAGLFMVYMQAIRFLTDYLNNDIYYGSRYEGHNLVRAGNQVTLLKKLQEFNPG